MDRDKKDRLALGIITGAGFLAGAALVMMESVWAKGFGVEALVTGAMLLPCFIWRMGHHVE